MKKNITKEEEKALLEIAKRLMAAVDSRGDLEERGNDGEETLSRFRSGESRKQWRKPTCWARQKSKAHTARHSTTQGLVPRVAKRSE